MARLGIVSAARRLLNVDHADSRNLDSSVSPRSRALAFRCTLITRRGSAKRRRPFSSAVRLEFPFCPHQECTSSRRRRILFRSAAAAMYTVLFRTGSSRCSEKTTGRSPKKAPDKPPRSTPDACGTLTDKKKATTNVTNAFLVSLAIVQSFEKIRILYPAVLLENPSSLFLAGLHSVLNKFFKTF